MRLVVPAPAQVTVPVAGGGDFPVRRVYCVGRNYAEHVREMGGDEREPPFFFQKPADAIVPDGAEVPYPPFTSDFQHEVELVLAIGAPAFRIEAADAASVVFGVAVGIDLTRRDVQIAARKSGRPWEIGKSFDRSAPCSAIVPLKGRALPTAGRIALSVNGEVKQQGDLAQLIWSCNDVVAQLSAQYRLLPGDLIYTGTPAGVGPLRPGDRVEAVVEGVGRLAMSVVEDAGSLPSAA